MVHREHLNVFEIEREISLTCRYVMTFKNIVLNLLRGQIQQSSFLLKKRHRNRFVQTTFLSFSMFSLFKLSKIDFL